MSQCWHTYNHTSNQIVIFKLMYENLLLNYIVNSSYLNRVKLIAYHKYILLYTYIYSHRYVYLIRRRVLNYEVKNITKS